jgi:hypothetical protein
MLADTFKDRPHRATIILITTPFEPKTNTIYEFQLVNDIMLPY